VPRDYFVEFGHCLDRRKTREENLQSLKAYEKRVRNWSDGLAELEVLKEALKRFANEAAYEAYLSELRGTERTRGKEEKARERRLQDDLKAERQRREEAERQAELHAAQARLQALQAEQAKRRETERAQRLQRELEAERRQREEVEREAERELEAERQQREEAEREAERAKNQGSGGWADVARGILGALTATSAAPSQPAATTDLTGVWRAPDGHVCRIWQSGSSVRIQLWDPWNRPVADSAGAYDGRLVQVNFTTVPIPTMWGMVPTHGVATMQLVNGGHTLQGQSLNHVTGQASPILMHRAS
jgi:hypothetical protein